MRDCRPVAASAYIKGHPIRSAAMIRYILGAALLTATDAVAPAVVKQALPTGRLEAALRDSPVPARAAAGVMLRFRT